MSNHVNQSIKTDAGSVLDFNEVYLSHLPKIKACIRKLDYLSSFKRPTDQINELAQDFFTKVWAENILDQFDNSRAKSKDAILAFLYNHLRNFYSSIRTKEIQYRETNKKLLINGYFNRMANNQVSEEDNYKVKIKLESLAGVKKKGKDKAHEDSSKLEIGAVSNFSKTEYNEDNGFCHDIKKVGKAFIRSLKGLEKKAWKKFIYDGASADKVANELGIGRMTSFRLKDSINHKAKIYLKGYYAGSLTLN